MRRRPRASAQGGSPGSHPHSDRPNWRPAETVEEYLNNVREGLEPADTCFASVDA